MKTEKQIIQECIDTTINLAAAIYCVEGSPSIIKYISLIDFIETCARNGITMRFEITGNVA